MKTGNLKNLFLSKRKDKEKLDFRPHGFWNKVMSMFLLTVLAFLGLSLFLFYQILHDRIFVVEIQRTDPLQIVEEEKINQVVLKINQKAERFEVLQAERSNIIDPAR